MGRASECETRNVVLFSTAFTTDDFIGRSTGGSHPRVEKKNIISTGAAGDATSRNVNVVVSGINSVRCDESKFAVAKDATIAGKFECRCLMYVAMLPLSVGDFLRLRIDNRKRYRIPIEQRMA